MRIPAVIFLVATIGSAACTAAIGLDNYHLTSGSGGAGGAGTSASTGGAGGVDGTSTGSGTSGTGGAMGCASDEACNPGKKVVGFCFTPICNIALGMCENDVKNGVALPVQTPGDCHSAMCVNGDETSTVDSSDVSVDSIECTSDLCVGGIAQNPPKQAGTPCGMGTGSACDAVGTCVPLGSNGSACAAPSACASNVCTDGVCCDVACSGLCKACIAAKTGASSGKCANILNGTDPDNECAGVIACNGSGACGGGLLANGVACVDSSQCTSNACADGVCCNTLCSGVCKSCLGSKTGDVDGHCKDILDFTDPDNECPGASVCDGAVCN